MFPKYWWLLVFTFLWALLPIDPGLDIYLSLSQAFYKESTCPECYQGLGRGRSCDNMDRELFPQNAIVQLRSKEINYPAEENFDEKDKLCWWKGINWGKFGEPGKGQLQTLLPNFCWRCHLPRYHTVSKEVINVRSFFWTVFHSVEILLSWKLAIAACIWPGSAQLPCKHILLERAGDRP